MPFLSFDAALAIALGHTPNTDSFAFQSSFTLSSAAPAIKPLTQPVTIQTGNYSVTIPPGSFKRGDSSYDFSGVIDGVTLTAKIAPAGTLRYTFAATTSAGVNLSGIKNPVPVGLTIGEDCGKASVTATITP